MSKHPKVTLSVTFVRCWLSPRSVFRSRKKVRMHKRLLRLASLLLTACGTGLEPVDDTDEGPTVTYASDNQSIPMHVASWLGPREYDLSHQADIPANASRVYVGLTVCVSSGYNKGLFEWRMDETAQEMEVLLPCSSTGGFGNTSEDWFPVEHPFVLRFETKPVAIGAPETSLYVVVEVLGWES